MVRDSTIAWSPQPEFVMRHHPYQQSRAVPPPMTRGPAYRRRAAMNAHAERQTGEDWLSPMVIDDEEPVVHQRRVVVDADDDGQQVGVVPPPPFPLRNAKGSPGWCSTTTITLP